MARGRHRLTRRRGATALSAVAATAGVLVLVGSGVFPPSGPAAADVTPPSVPITYAYFQLPDPGTGGTSILSPLTVEVGLPGGGQVDVGQIVSLPSIGGGGESCFETADTGWVCTPVVPVGDLTAGGSLTTFIDVLEAPDDAVPDGLAPDPNAPLPVPDGSVDWDPNPPQGPSTSGPYCSGWGTATWENPIAVHYGYGTLNCPPDHWFKGYYYIDDRTTSAWPVQNYTSYWSNNVNGLTIGYGCPSSSHCVKVVEGRYGTSYKDSSGNVHPQWVGLTTFTVDGHNRFVSVGVKFNDSWSMTPAEHSATVCHELGHTAGLGHETQNTSCMWRAAQLTSGNSDDFNQLYFNTYAPNIAT